MYNQNKLTRGEIIWQIVIVFAIAFSAIEAPISSTLDLPLKGWQVWVDAFISLLFIIDIVKNIKNKKSRGKSRKHSHPLSFDLTLLVDIIASIPFDVISYFFGFSSVIRILRMLRLLRLIKIVSLFSTMGNFTILPSSIKIQFVILASIIAINWITCGWIILHPPQTMDLLSYYVQSLYWAITTLTTIGYGDITPTTIAGRLYTMVIMILGVGVYGIVIGNVSRMITMADRYKEQSKEKIRDLSLFMKHYNIPDRLQYAVFSYYNHLYTKRLSDNDTKIISDLPNALQAELQTYMNMKLIANVPVFKSSSHNCLLEIAGSLEQMYFSPGQHIINRDEIGDEMFIIGHGTAEVVVKDNVVATLNDGQFFGELALLEKTKRNADVKAVTYCDLYKLSKDSFLEIIKKYPELLKSMQQIINKRTTDRQ